MRSFLAGWRASLHRTRSDWPLVVAAWFVMLLAATLLSAGAIYPPAVAEAGLRQALADAPAADSSIEVRLYAKPADASSLDARVQDELQHGIAPLAVTVLREWRSSATLALPKLPGSAVGDQATIGFLDDLPEHATLVAGAWPRDGADPAEPIPVVVAASAAAALGLVVGDDLGLVARPSDQPVPVPARLVGTYAVDSGADAFWHGDERLLNGVEDTGSYRTFGPFLTTANHLLLAPGTTQLDLRWRAVGSFQGLLLDEAGPLRDRVEALPGRLQEAVGSGVFVRTGLPALLSDAERSLLVSRSEMLLLVAQLSILAAYAILLTAAQLMDHRRIQTALIRSRGADIGQIALLSLSEGLVIAIPVVVIAPWLAVQALNLLNIAGPLADARLAIAPQVTSDGMLAAAVAGVLGVVLLALPPFLAARGFAAEQSGLSRQETRTFGHRVGLDVVLLTLAGIGIWQLRLYGAPLTTSVRGSLGLDPLLVAAPAIGLLAGGILTLRILPLLAHAVAGAVVRSRGLVASLGSRELARRPLRYTRSALLVTLAMSMGVFVISYAATWAGSQRDQARYQAGADIRVMPSGRADGMPPWALPGAYTQLPNVDQALPVERVTDGVASLDGHHADLLALDADTAPDVVLFRPDESSEPLGTMLLKLRAGRPEPALATLPPGTTVAAITPVVDIGSISRLVVDPTTGDVKSVPADPATLAEVRVAATVVVRDARGLLYAFSSPIAPVGRPRTVIVVPLSTATDIIAREATRAGIDLELDGPVQIAGLGIDLYLPPDSSATDAVAGIAGLSAGTASAGPFTEVSLSAGSPWNARMGEGFDAPSAVAADQTGGMTVQLSGSGPHGAILGAGNVAPASRLTFFPGTLASSNQPVPVIVNRAFAAAAGSVPGESISARVAGVVQTLSIVGVVESFPTTDPSRPLFVLDEPTLGLLRLQESGTTRSADEWWLAAPNGAAESGATESLASLLRRGPWSSLNVVSAAERTQSLSTDPVALGIIGALSLGFVVTGLFAVIGLTAGAALSARQRRTEFALLRALGLSGGQLSRTLWLENGAFVVVSLIAGTMVGLLLGWLALPSITVTQRGTVPIPPVVVEVPWDRILILDAVSALALGIGVVAIGSVLRRLGVGSVLRMGED